MAATYGRAGREVFAPRRVHRISLSADATQLSGKDTLEVALYSPELQRVLWAPTQAEPFAACAACQKAVFVFKSTRAHNAA